MQYLLGIKATLSSLLGDIVTFEPQAFRTELAKSLIDAASDNYKDNARINASIDDKAQKVAGVAGVFLAAALAFIKIDNLKSVAIQSASRHGFTAAGNCLCHLLYRNLPSSLVGETISEVTNIWVSAGTSV